MKFYIKIAAAAVVCALLFGVYFFVQARQEAQADTTPPAPAHNLHLIAQNLGTFETATITRKTGSVTITHQDGVITRSDQGDLVLDPELLSDIARGAFALHAAAVAFEDTAEISLAALGLDPAQMTVVSTFSDGTSHRLFVGYHSADVMRRFVMIDDDPMVYLVADLVIRRFEMELPELLDMYLPFFAMDNLTYFFVHERGREQIEIVLNEEMEGAIEFPGWQLDMISPFYGVPLAHWRITSDIIEPLWEFTLGELHEFLPESLAPFGLDEPALIARFESTTDSIGLNFGHRFIRDGVQHVYVAVEGRPHVFVAPFAGVSGLFDINPVILVDRFIALVSIFDVEGLTVMGPQGEFEIVVNHPDPALVEAGLARDDEIAPTINDHGVTDRFFRNGYRLTIGLLMQASVDPHMPPGEPEVVIIYHLVDDTQVVVELFRHTDSLFAAVVDGAAAWQLVSDRPVRSIFEHFARYREQ